MPSTWTDLDFEMQAAGENTNTWGADHLNNALSRINSAFGGYISIPITGDYSLTTVRPTTSMVPANFSGRIALLKFTGALAANATITVPATAMNRSIWNATNKVLTITTGAGSTVTIDAGDKNVVWCDGSGVHQISFAGYGLKEYIAAIALSGAELPAQLGNAGKFIKTDGTNATWQQILGSDLASWTASPTVVLVGTSTALAMTPGDTYGAFAEVALTSTGNSVALDFATMVNGYHDLTENTTLANPTNAKVGQSGWIRVRQHASSAKTCATGTNWYRVGGDLAVSTTLSGYNIYEYQVIATNYILYDLLREPSNA